MAKFYYWAVRPIGTDNTMTRIERAITARNACILAFGRGHSAFEAKNLGTQVAVIQSDTKRVALLQDPTGWEPIT